MIPNEIFISKCRNVLVTLSLFVFSCNLSNLALPVINEFNLYHIGQAKSNFGLFPVPNRIQIGICRQIL